MLFNSDAFLVFFPVVTLLYFLLPHKLRCVWLLAASCFFYMFFKPVYILILAFTIVIDYFAGMAIEGAIDKKIRKRYLILSILANIGVLAFFKYYNFINGNITGLALLFGAHNPVPFLRIALPIGLSFHTFQAMSYTIEVYRGKQKAESNFGIYALYVMFYPQLVAGPIERPQNLIHQFREKHNFDPAACTEGLKQILWGFFKKLVIADRLAIVVNNVYNHPANFHGFAFVVATIFFSIQIYCDFAGYSDIAIGCARVMGFRLMSNFDRPYFSTSFSAFWTRWHISLSSWFRDYVYIPLGGNRVKFSRLCFNILIVFLLSGLWHGANWTFLIWGGLNAIYLLVEMIVNRPGRNRINNVPRSFLSSAFSATFTFILISFAWIFFRATSVKNALYVISNMFVRDKQSSYFSLADAHIPGAATTWLGMSPIKILCSAALIPLLLVLESLQRGNNFSRFNKLPVAARWMAYYVVIFAIIFFGIFDTRQFIYYQF